LFGDIKAFLPLTQTGANQDDAAALGRGFIRIVPGARDPTGRPILFVDPSRQDKTQYTRESMTRALWYVMHATLQKAPGGSGSTSSSSSSSSDDSQEEHSDLQHVLGQQKGIVVIAYPHKAKASQVDRKQIQMNVESFRGYLPVRMSAIHLCHPPTFFHLIFPVISMFLGDRLRKRIRIHSGKVEHVLEGLESKYGLTRDKLPSEIGGDVELNHELWLQDRAVYETKHY
jgi:CRAL/TRIO domain